jgi:hypothetical protein
MRFRFVPWSSHQPCIKGIMQLNVIVVDKVTKHRHNFEDVELMLELNKAPRNWMYDTNMDFHFLILYLTLKQYLI